jgi:predicted nucleic acid-binding protein
VKEQIVTDSTCLIGLERIGHLDVLQQLFEPIQIPPTVDQEFGLSFSWLTVTTPTDQTLVAALNLLIDEGEAEAIALASELRCRVILDDRRARLVAAKLNVNIIGTVGVLVKAKQNGIIAALKPVLDALEMNEFFISETLRQEALQIVGE